jgi:hypothetical protein
MSCIVKTTFCVLVPTDDMSEWESLERLLQAVYQPYRPYLLKYKVFEEVALSKALDSIKLVCVRLLFGLQKENVLLYMFPHTNMCSVIGAQL